MQALGSGHGSQRFSLQIGWSTDIASRQKSIHWPPQPPRRAAEEIRRACHWSVRSRGLVGGKSETEARVSGLQRSSILLPRSLSTQLELLCVFTAFNNPCIWATMNIPCQDFPMQYHSRLKGLCRGILPKLCPSDAFSDRLGSSQTPDAWH